MTPFSNSGDWKRFALLVLLAALVVAGYYVGSLTATPFAISKAQQDAIAEKALAAGNEAYAVAILEKLAKSGDTEAEYQLGEIYAIGSGVPRNGALAQSWLTRAATAGNVDAERQLGEMYLNGQLIVQDFAKARTWLSKAADAGNTTAIRLLGDMTAEGLGQKADPVSAYAWYEVAALRGDAYAGIKRDKILAKLDPGQQQQGEADAKTRLGKIASANPQAALSSSAANKTVSGSGATPPSNATSAPAGTTSAVPAPKS